MEAEAPKRIRLIQPATRGKSDTSRLASTPCPSLAALRQPCYPSRPVLACELSLRRPNPLSIPARFTEKPPWPARTARPDSNTPVRSPIPRDDGNNQAALDDRRQRRRRRSACASSLKSYVDTDTAKAQVFGTRGATQATDATKSQSAAPQAANKGSGKDADALPQDRRSEARRDGHRQRPGHPPRCARRRLRRPLRQGHARKPRQQAAHRAPLPQPQHHSDRCRRRRRNRPHGQPASRSAASNGSKCSKKSAASTSKQYKRDILWPTLALRKLRQRRARPSAMSNSTKPTKRNMAKPSKRRLIVVGDREAGRATSSRSWPSIRTISPASPCRTR